MQDYYKISAGMFLDTISNFRQFRHFQKKKPSPKLPTICCAIRPFSIIFHQLNLSWEYEEFLVD
jgi:hypothetical protein